MKLESIVKEKWKGHKYGKTKQNILDKLMSKTGEHKGN